MTNISGIRPIDNRDCLVSIIDPDLSVCETLSLAFRLEGFQTNFGIDLGSCFGLVDKRAPQAILCAKQFVDGSALAVVHLMRRVARGTAIVILDSDPTVQSTVDLMRAGASFVFQKPFNIEELLGAVRTEIHARVRVDGRRKAGREITIGGFNSLSPREHQVLQIIVDGHTSREAAKDLGISPRTVEVHRANIMQKMGARNIADLVRIITTS